jgi:PucR-like helix-turn-helix protein/diguanylate cyclase with GGDEF domain
MQNVQDFSQTWSMRLRAEPIALSVIAALWRDRQAYAQRVVEMARSNPDFHTAIDPDYVQTARHVLQHFHAFRQLATGRGMEPAQDPLGFIRTHAVLRARQQFPLTALLRAYRSGHKGFWLGMRQLVQQMAASAEEAMRTALLLSDYAMEYTDLISVAVTSAYLEEERQLAAQRTRVSIAVLEDLLRGTTPETEEGRLLCARAGLGNGRSMVVLVAQPLRADDATADAAVHALAAIVEAIEATLLPPDFGRLVDIRAEQVIAIASGDGEVGRAAAVALHARAKNTSATAWPALIGVGLDVAVMASLPRSYAEARCALDMANEQCPIVHLADVDIDVYLRRTADPTAHRLVPRWITALVADAAGASALSRTLAAFAEANLNVKRCANRLGVHNNTVYHRLNRIHRLTGIDPRSFAGLRALMTALHLTTENRDAERRSEASVSSRRVRTD